MRLGIQNWAKEHPTYTNVVEMAMNTIEIGIKASFYITLAAGVIFQPEISVPVIIGTIAYKESWNRLIDLGISKLAEYAGTCGISVEEKQHFKESVFWVADKLKSCQRIYKASRIISTISTQGNYKALQTLSESVKRPIDLILLVRQINKDSSMWYKEKSMEMLAEVLSRLGSI